MCKLNTNQLSSCYSCWRPAAVKILAYLSASSPSLGGGYNLGTNSTVYISLRPAALKCNEGYAQLQITSKEAVCAFAENQCSIYPTPVLSGFWGVKAEPKLEKEAPCCGFRDIGTPWREMARSKRNNADRSCTKPFDLKAAPARHSVC